MNTASSFALAGMLLVSSTASPVSAAAKTDQISIRYAPPANPEHQALYEDMKQRGALEKLQKLLSPIRLPGTLQISLDGCDGEPDAFYDYDDTAITICYEYIAELLEHMPDEAPASDISPVDTIIGPLFEVSLHEAGHALFDMLELPVLGREEDAADQLAAYILLQAGKSAARRLIAGTVYAYKIEEEKTEGCRGLEDYAGEHSTPAQRAFNLMCIAYGFDHELFSDIASEGYLPMTRAEYCDEEYEQVQYAFETLIRPHIDPRVAEQIRDGTWVCESRANGASENCLLEPLK